MATAAAATPAARAGENLARGALSLAEGARGSAEIDYELREDGRKRCLRCGLLITSYACKNFASFSQNVVFPQPGFPITTSRIQL